MVKNGIIQQLKYVVQMDIYMQDYGMKQIMVEQQQEMLKI